MKNNKTDGSYLLEFTRSNDIKETKNFGYYSNGKTTSRASVIFEIKNDSIISRFGTTNQNEKK